MAIGERIRFLRNLKGMTQKWLGMAVGFDEKTAENGKTQYFQPTFNGMADIFLLTTLGVTAPGGVGVQIL